MTTLSEAYAARIEFYNQNQPRDKAGMWTRGGAARGPSPDKVWAGVSAHPDRRKAPRVNHDYLDKIRTDPESAARQMYNTDLGGGYRSEVTAADFDDYDYSGGQGSQFTLAVTGNIKKGSLIVGSFVRQVNLEGGTLSVYHDTLTINSAHQGAGLADRFNSHAVAEYQKMGVDNVSLEAGLTVGGYAWARQGFRYKEQDTDRVVFLNKVLKSIESSVATKLVLEPHKRKLRKEITAVRKAIEAGEDVQPIHLASIGEGYARHTSIDDDYKEYETWPGKSAFIGRTWDGVYYFDAANPVTASATSLEHASLRPAFGMSTDLSARLTEALACHTAACRPPTSGGSGGSLPKGWDKGAQTLPDDDTDEPTVHLSSASVGFLGVDNSDEHHERWEGARELFKPEPSELSRMSHAEQRAWQLKRHDEMVAAHGSRQSVGPGEVWASQVHLRLPNVERLTRESADSVAIGVRYGGKTYVMDGHHRVAARWMKGEKADLDVIDIDALERAHRTVQASALEEFTFDPRQPRDKEGQWTTLYHGTRASNVEAIKSRGLTMPDGVVGSSIWFMLTSSKEQAEGYAMHDDGVVIEYKIPTKRIFGQEGPEDPRGDLLWPGHEHNVYDHNATAYAVRKPLPGEFIVDVHKTKKNMGLSALAEAFACHEASCRPPTSGGTGGSSPRKSTVGFPGQSLPRNARVQPKHLIKSLDKRTMDALGIGDEDMPTKKRAHEFIKSWFNPELPDGHTIAVKVTGSGDTFEVNGSILNKHGRLVGDFERTVHFDPVTPYEDPKRKNEWGTQERDFIDGAVVIHEGLHLQGSTQGSGIGRIINEHAVAAYQRWGIDHVQVHAGDNVGGYAWAVAGFRIEDGNPSKELGGGYNTSRHGAIGQFATKGEKTLAALVAAAHIPDYHRDQAVKELNALVQASWSGQDVQPIHVASIGESTMRFTKPVADRDQAALGVTYETWPGKEIMLGTNWLGSYYFGEAVTASAAVEEFYDASQARDRNGRWTAHRSGITSLARDTLDRAINNGVRGVFSDGDTGMTPWPRAPRIKGKAPFDQSLVDEALRKPPVLEKVDPRILFATQPGLVRSHVNYYMGDEYKRTGKTAADQSSKANAFPMIYVKANGQHVILTGHHRSAAALLRGEDVDAIIVREPT